MECTAQYGEASWDENGLSFEAYRPDENDYGIDSQNNSCCKDNAVMISHSACRTEPGHRKSIAMLSAYQQTTSR
eukprot:3271757-Amphidinium_carterae.1